MSNVYILEPPTTAKVLLKTTVGDIDIELWAKETPKTCRNFIQLCMEGYYNNTIFHRVVKEFIVQGGDPKGDGTGGESIYGETFKDEFHQRLRFTRRGLLAMANAGKDDNGSQFFFTLGPTPELQNVHTIFGKVTGETVFNMLKLEEGLLDGETPVYPHKIIKTEVLNSYFENIQPRIVAVPLETFKKKKKTEKGVKNFKLLSFGAEAEEDEDESSKLNEKFIGKGKSAYDVSDQDQTIIETAKENEADSSSEDNSTDEENRLENIKKKLKTGKSSFRKSTRHFNDDEIKEHKSKVEKIQQEIKELKKDYHKNKLKKIEGVEEEKVEEKDLSEYNNVKSSYKEQSNTIPPKGSAREQMTLKLLDKFKDKLNSAKAKIDDESEDSSTNAEVDSEEWMAHKLKCQEEAPILAKDANTKDDDWFEIYDPRNPLNKRRRGEASKNLKK